MHSIKISAQDRRDTITNTLDGDGREVKRKKVNYTEDPNATQWPYGSWVEEEPIYYIRSTVLGGQVISETTGTGAKKKTYVLAAGAKIATQSEYTYNSSTTESVTFDHFDVSGMSYRSSMSSGTVNTADGQYEGAPAEMDPMGGNVGLATPYIEVPPDPPPPDEIMPFFPLDGDSTMYVNGQKVSCMLDGMSVGCGFAFSGLGTSSDIDFANTSPGVLSQLGVVAIRIPGIIDAPTPANGNSGTAYATQDRYEYFFNNVSWGPQVQSPQVHSQQPKIPLGAPYSKKQLNALGDAFNEALNRLKSARCAELFTDFYDKIIEDLSRLEAFDKTGGISDLKSEFENTADRDPSNVLANVTFRYLPLSAGVGAATPDRSNVFINKNGPFVSRNIFVGGQLKNADDFDFGITGVARLSQKEYGALLLLHELGHAYGYLGKNAMLFGPDANDKRLNLEYTKSVIEACFPEIKLK